MAETSLPNGAKVQYDDENNKPIVSIKLKTRANFIELLNKQWAFARW